MILLYIILLLVNIYIIYSIKEPSNFTAVKEKYSRLRKYISNSDDIEPKFKPLKNQVILTGFLKNRNDELGYNINKGGEIGLCLDGTPNEIFHVLIHELAHTVSSKYAHDEEFWENEGKIRTMCQQLGLYSPISNKTEFCGSHIRDV
jgi:hypothetical protein